MEFDIPDWIEDGAKWSALAWGVSYARRHPVQTKAVARTVAASGLIIALTAGSFSELAAQDRPDNADYVPRLELNHWHVSGPTTSVMLPNWQNPSTLLIRGSRSG